MKHKLLTSEKIRHKCPSSDDKSFTKGGHCRNKNNYDLLAKRSCFVLVGSRGHVRGGVSCQSSVTRPSRVIEDVSRDAVDPSGAKHPMPSPPPLRSRDCHDVLGSRYLSFASDQCTAEQESLSKHHKHSLNSNQLPNRPIRSQRSKRKQYKSKSHKTNKRITKTPNKPVCVEKNSKVTPTEGEFSTGLDKGLLYENQLKDGTATVSNSKSRDCGHVGKSRRKRCCKSRGHDYQNIPSVSRAFRAAHKKR